VTSSAPQPPGRSADTGASPAHGGLEGVARDASTITDVLDTFEAAGYTAQFIVRSEGVLECAECKARFAGSAARIDALRRLEGASDPDDMIVVAALVCPRCGARGTVVLGYGPAASEEDALALVELDRAPPPDPGDVEQPADS
jgi:hypothetical protein